MPNMIEYKNKVAFHPGYYIQEYIQEYGYTQEDLAYRLGTTPKNISYLIRGEQSISIDIANKLAKLIGTSVNYWLNLQNEYDTILYEINNEKEVEEERKVFSYIQYSYFRNYFGLPDLSKRKDEQIKAIREFLKVSSLTVFKKEEMYLKFKSINSSKTESNLVIANIMVHIATNISLQNKDYPKYNKILLESKLNEISSLTIDKDPINKLENILKNVGIDLIILPNITGSKINGAAKKIGNHVVLMISDRNNNVDAFWFALFHELGHIINNDLGISFEGDTGELEDQANLFAQNQLIPLIEYEKFIKRNDFSVDSIYHFSEKLNRNINIVIGRLKKDNYVSYQDRELNLFRYTYDLVSHFLNEYNKKKD